MEATFTQSIYQLSDLLWAKDFKTYVVSLVDKRTSKMSTELK